MWIKIGTIAGVVAAVATVVGLVLVRSNTNNGNQCSADRGGSVECYKDVIPPASERNEAKLIEEAKSYVDKPPAGPGPWPFVVVRDLEKGLKVRTNNLVSGTQIGALPHLNTAWAVCKQHSGFDPEGNGDLWYKIKWDHQQPNTKEYFESEPGATGTGWVHSYYLVPVNHNGQIPDC